MKHTNKTQSSVSRKVMKIGTVILMGFLWFLCSLPIVTIGAASAAMYRVIFDLRAGEPCNVKTFFKAFIKKFLNATLVWIALLLFGVVLRGIPGILAALKMEMLLVVGLALVGALFLLLYVVLICSFPLCGYFDAGLKKTLRNAIFVATHNRKQAILTSVLTAMPLIVFLVDPMVFFYTCGVWLLLYPGLVFYLGAKLFQPAFDEYRQRREERELEEAQQEEKDYETF